MIRYILNKLKLFFGILIFVSVIMLWFEPLMKKRNMVGEELLAIIVVSALFGSIGLLFIRWYYKTKKKYATAVNEYQSAFYVQFKFIIDLFDGYSFNGFGTKYMVYSNKNSDGSFTATKWMVIGTFPVAALYRNRILIKKETDKINPALFYVNIKEVEIISKEKLSRTPNRFVYFFYYLFFFPAFILPIALMLANLDYLNEKFPGPLFWYLILFYFGWGLLVIFLSEMFTKRFFLRKHFK